MGGREDRGSRRSHTPGGARWRTARLLARLASFLVPRGRRAAWHEEWQAELWHAASARPGEPLVGPALGSVRDALAARRLTRRGADGAARGSRTDLLEGMKTMGRELKVAARSLLRAPGFTAVAVLTLALGLGGSTAIFTLIDRVVLDPLPYPEAGRLVRLRNQVPGVGPGSQWHLATGQWVLYDEAARTLESVGLWRTGGVNVDTPSGSQRARAAEVTVEMMDLLGAEAALGRLITADDDLPDAPPVALLSHGFWTRAWGSDPDVLGRTVEVNGTAVEVIGVVSGDLAPPTESGAPGAAPPDLWMPLRIDRGGPHWNHHVYRSVALLAPEAGPTDVERELAGLRPRLVERFPEAYSQGFFDRYGFRQSATPLDEDVVGDMARNLWILLGAVGLVLVVACANVANLLLARMEERRRELAVRSALGAGRATIARHLVSESLVLSLAGGALAVLVARWGLPALIAAAPDTLPRMDAVEMDTSALAFAAALSLLVGLGLALLPLLRHGRLRGVADLAGSGRWSSAGRGRQRLRSALVVAQVALALTLAVGAGLLLESLRRLHAVDPGFEPRGVLTTELYVNPATHPNPDAVWLFLDEVLERVGALPGVEAAGTSPELPLTGGYGCTVQGFEDAAVYQRLEAAEMTTCAGQQLTTPGYFEAMGIPVLEGRAFTDADNDDPGRGVAVVSRAYAERFWPGEDPLGRGIAPSGMTEGPFYRVVGVVGDVQGATLQDEPAVVVHYPVRPIPSARFSWPGRQTLVIRTELSDPMTLFPAVRRAVRDVDPSTPLANPRTMEDVVAASLGRASFVSLLLGVAAAAALLLAAVGLYGVVSYVVSRRTREIGMRMAMGARPGRVRREIVGGSLVLTAVGLGLGAALALATTRVLEGLLFGVEPTHPAVFSGAAALLAAVALAAAWLPARRASRVDPAEALRAE